LMRLLASGAEEGGGMVEGMVRLQTSLAHA
jgi:hypothetical protein